MLQRAFAPSGLCQKNFRAALQEPGELRDALREGRGSAARGRLGGPRAEQRGCDDAAQQKSGDGVPGRLPPTKVRENIVIIETP